MKRFFLSLFAFALLIPATGHSSVYSVDKEKSAITFSGTHADTPFTGEFKGWNASIDFDDNHLENSKVSVTFETGEAKTGNAMYDGTLPTKDWFDSDNNPTATFTSDKIEKTADGYMVSGTLTLRGISKPISFPFTLTDSEPRIMNASFPIDRLAFDVGKGSDPSAEWVGKDINITIDITASPAL